MRWTCICLAATVAGNALDTAISPDAAPEARHKVSLKVQQALDELRQISSVQTTKPTSTSRRMIGYIRSILIHSPVSNIPSTSTSSVFDEPLRKLKEASEEDQDEDATFLLAEMAMHGNYSYPRNYHDALHYYTIMAESNGNLTAHENLALLYSTGLQGIESDQGLALAHHTFAAGQGSIRSHMALGYRHLNGIGVAPNCSAACEHYATAAGAAVEWIRSGPPGGMYWNRKAYRYSDELGGLYGHVPTRPYPGAVLANSKELDDVIDYYTYIAEKADIPACFQLAKLYNDGTRTVEQDFVKSLYWFRQVARSYWTKDGKTVKNAKAMRYHAKSAAYIATAYLRGQGTEQDFEKAKLWFQRGVSLGDPTAQNGLALMHLIGLGPIQRNLVKAEELFKAAADSDHKGAQLNLGKILVARGDVVGATRLFEYAAAAGRAEAFFYLAQFFQHGVGVEKNCAMATQYYKIVAESVESLHSTIAYANEAYREGRIEDAVVGNLIASESGYEVGQVNVAFLLDKHSRAFSTKAFLRSKVMPHVNTLRQKLGLPDKITESPSDRSISDELALLYYSRSAAQQNLEALVKAGDFYYYGHGTTSDPEKAVSLWTTAAESRAVPLAMWNVAWAYENGIGVEQDFHMAKRYYDACLETDKKAYLPVSLSLLKLRARSAWNTVTGGSINSIKDDEKREAKVTWSSIWTGIKHFWRSQWELPEIGTSAESEASDQGNFVDEDYPVSQEDLYDTLLILGVCLIVAGIVYVRTAWWPPTRRNHGAGAPPQPDGPNPHIAEWIGGAAI